MKDLLLQQTNVQKTAKIDEAQKEWEIIFNAIEEGISIHDVNFNILDANQSLAKILNITPFELIGKKCYEVIHHLSEPLKGCPYLQTIETKRVSSTDVEIPLLKKEFNISIYPLFNSEIGLKGFVHIMRDINEQKRFHAELLQLERLSAMGQLIAGFAHEINSSLGVVMGYAQLHKGSKELSEEIKEDLEKLYCEAIRTSKIVQNLLSLVGIFKHPQ
jgi:PAS domain S-box-containing protein